MRLVGSFATLVIVGLLAVFGWQSYQQYRQPVALKFVVTSWTTAQLVSAVASRNFFAGRGLNVKIINVGEDYEAALRAVQTGEADGGVFPLSAPIKLTLSGFPMRVVAGVDYSSGADGIVAASGIISVADLKGKRVAYEAGSYDELLLREVLQENNLSIADVISVPTMAEAVPQAFLKGEVDAVVSFQPFLDQALRRPESTVLFSSASLPGFIPDVIAFREDAIENNRSAVQTFLGAWFDGIAELKKDSHSRREMLAVIAVVGGTTITDVERSLTSIKLYNFNDNAIAFTYTDDLLSLYRSSQEFIDFRAGYLTKPIGQVVRDIIDPSFIRSGLRQ